MYLYYVRGSKHVLNPNSSDSLSAIERDSDTNIQGDNEI